MLGKVELCREDSLEPGQMIRFEPQGMDPVLLINDSGELRLIEDDCTHGLASLSEGRLEGHVIFCPLHGGSFDIRTGKACGLPCKQSLRTFQVAVEDGVVCVTA